MMTKAKEEITDGTDQQNGFREGINYPIMPTTVDGYKKLLVNPDKSAEYQTAPSNEQLNPHLFG